MTITYINRKKAGLCVDCGQPADGKVRCKSCARKMSIEHYAREWERRKQGLCIWCGKPSEERLCPSCREIERRRAREWKEKKRATVS